MKTKVFCMMVLCTGLLVGCDKETEKPEIPENPPVENPEKPSKVPSTDGIIKTKIGDINMIVGTGNWTDIVYENGKYIVVGGNMNKNNSTFATASTNGINWNNPTEIIYTPSGGQEGGIISSLKIAYGNGKFVACSSDLQITISSDGLNWSPLVDLPLGYGLQGIAFGNGKFVTVGRGGYIYISSDGINWTSHKTGSTNFRCVAFGNGKFVVSGDGYAITSPDGITWSSLATTGNSSLGSIVFVNGKFMAVGNNNNTGKGTIISSVDGINWENEITFDIQPVGIIYNRGKFIAVGYTSVYSGGKWNYTDYVTTSIDGVNWTTPEILKDESGNTITADINAVCAMP